MNKTFRVFGMILLVMLVTVSISACSSDDDDTNPSIVGTWYTESTLNIGTPSDSITYSEITYKSDGTATGYWKSTYKNGEIEIDTDKGHYEVINDILSIWWDGEDGAWSATFSISGNIMTTSENGGTIWTRK